MMGRKCKLPSKQCSKIFEYFRLISVKKLDRKKSEIIRLYFDFFIENVEYLQMQFLEFKTRLYFDFFIENVDYYSHAISRI